MSNQSFITVPTDVTNPSQLKTFLLRLVESLDGVIGNRGEDGYIPRNQSEEQLQELDDAISDRFVVVFEQISDLDASLTALTSRVTVNEGDIGQLIIDLADLNDVVDNALIDIAALEVRVLDNETDISGILVSLSNIEADVSNAQIAIANLDTRLGVAELQIDSLEERSLPAGIVHANDMFIFAGTHYVLASS